MIDIIQSIADLCIVGCLVYLSMRLRDIPRWHISVHSNCDYTKLAEANKMIDNLNERNREIDKENKKLKVMLSIKEMNDSLQKGDKD